MEPKKTTRRCIRSAEKTKKLYAKSGDATMLIGLFKTRNRAMAAASMIKDTIEAYEGECKITFITPNQ